MMPDRYLDSKVRQLAKPKVKNPYSAARAPLPAAAETGQVQPNFAEMPQVSMDPMQAQMPPLPPALSGRAPNIGLRPGAENTRGAGYEQSVGRGKTLNLYQDPTEYETHLNTVMNSPMMKELAEGTAQMKQLRSDFLKTAPSQTDLSPVMAFADFLSKGKGNAQAGYKRPASYEDLVKDIHGMLGDEQKSRQATAQLAYEQAGGLKSGTEEAQTKAGSTLKGEEGYKIPHPPMTGMMMPFNQAQAIGNTYEKVAKDANDTIKNALETKKLLANPSWYTDNAMKGAIVRGIGVNRITQNELFLLGGGSQDLISTIDRAFSKASSGQTLLQSDRHAIEHYNELVLKGGLEKRDQIHAQMGNAYNGITVLPGNKVGDVMSGRDIPTPAAPSGGSEAERAQAFAAQFMNMMKGGK